MGTHETGSGGDAEPVPGNELVRYVGGELTPAEEEELRIRIDRDPTAQQRLEQMRWVDAWFPPPPPVEAPSCMPDDMADRIRTRIRSEVDRIARGDGPSAAPWSLDEDRHPDTAGDPAGDEDPE